MDAKVRDGKGEIGRARGLRSLTQLKSSAARKRIMRTVVDRTRLPKMKAALVHRSQSPPRRQQGEAGLPRVVVAGGCSVLMKRRVCAAPSDEACGVWKVKNNNQTGKRFKKRCKTHTNKQELHSTKESATSHNRGNQGVLESQSNGLRCAVYGNIGTTAATRVPIGRSKTRSGGAA